MWKCTQINPLSPFLQIQAALILVAESVLKKNTCNQSVYGNVVYVCGVFKCVVLYECVVCVYVLVYVPRMHFYPVWCVCTCE